MVILYHYLPYKVNSVQSLLGLIRKLNYRIEVVLLVNIYKWFNFLIEPFAKKSA